jgi:hypothetical protein
MAIKVKVNIDNMMNRAFEALKREVDIRVTRAFQMACKEAVTFAKTQHGYTQQSGALNSSTGFQLYKEGALVDDYFETGGGDGTGHNNGINAGKKVAAERASQLGAHICAIIVAGMPYAVYVESKGFDVLAGAEKQFPAILEKWLKEAFADSSQGISYQVNG